MARSSVVTMMMKKKSITKKVLTCLIEFFIITKIRVFFSLLYNYIYFYCKEENIM